MSLAHKRLLASLTRLGLVAVYTLMGWGLCHDGTTAGEFVAMFVVGAVVLWFIVLADWIAAGPGQLDRGEMR